MEEILKQNISDHLKKRGISLAELSRVSRVPYRTLQDIMALKREARITTVAAIAKGLDLDSGALLGTPQPVSNKEQEMAERLRLFDLIPDLDKDQVSHFLAMMETELGISPSASASTSLPDKPKKA